MAALYEAISKISSESLYPNSQRGITKKILKNYIQSFDEYGDYFTQSEYQAFQKSLQAEYAGVGMLLYQQKGSDNILCIPFKNHLKELDIAQYDQLISVNGKPVKGNNFYIVSTWIKGKVGTKVILRIRKSSGVLRTITLERKMQQFNSVQRVRENGMVMLRIIHFTKETPAELYRALRQWPKQIPIVIDLRGNGGGDLYAAIQAVDLLLPEGKSIASIETKKERLDYNAANPDVVKGQAVILLQDQYTASAAEIFIAALVQNNRARSTGEKSYGKGVVQKFVSLIKGDALLLTYGKIITPNGKSYDKKGLLPTSQLPLLSLLKLEQ